MLDEDLLEQLSETPTLQALSAIVGVEAVVKLSEDLGGCTLDIPNAPGKHSPIAASIGVDAAKKIGQVYGGTRIYFSLTTSKKARVMRMIEQGKSANYIARTVKCSDRFVRKMRSIISIRNEHPSLFD